jgi:predicted nucleic acid-binding protein
MRIYVDTSVFGGVFDSEFSVPSQRFFEEIETGRFILVTSAIVQAEIEPAPEPIQALFRKFIDYAQIAPVEKSALQLQQKYLEAGIVTIKSFNDALHVAIATLSECDLIVSWNFKHIVHFDKIPKYNAINLLNGYRQIGIYSPLEVIQYEDART